MASRNRQHQGVAYGPVRPSGGSDGGRVFGNLLGLLVVALAVGLLAAGLYLLFVDRNPNPNSSTSPATALASAPMTSPSATAPGIEPSGGLLTAAPSSATSTPAITPIPTLYVPAVVTGPGYITFGTTVDSQLQVTDAKTTFAVDEPMVWTANLTEPANSADLQIRIYKLDASQPNGQKLVRVDPVQPPATDQQIYFRRLRPIGATLGKGLFTIQYVRGHDILSTGSFLVQ